MDDRPLYAEVVLPLALGDTFTYRIPQDEAVELQVGLRVAVPFGGSKLYTGLVHSWHSTTPELFKPKEIFTFLDDKPSIHPYQIQFWEWMAHYYMCSLGEVYRIAFPSGLKPESETEITLNPLFEEDFPEEFLDFQTFFARSSSATLKELGTEFGRTRAFKGIKELLALGCIQIKEVIQPKYKARKQRFVSLNTKLLEDSQGFNTTLQELERAPKQREFLLKAFAMQSGAKEGLIPLQELLKSSDTTHAVANALEKKKLIQLRDVEVSRLTERTSDYVKKPKLTAAQQAVFEEIQTQFQTKETVLLHGVTGSGKTEIYLHLIDAILQQNKTALLLLPEIALTSHMVSRLEVYFGDRLAVYHSHFNPSERVELWKNIQIGKFSVVIGARSAIFLPFPNLDFIVLDEEHDSAYKSNARNPLYAAKESTLYLAHLCQAKVLLGSATPSLESLHNASRKFGYTYLGETYAEAKRPEVHCIDMGLEKQKNALSGNFSHRLLGEIQHQIAQNKQVLIFQNRRGYAPMVECESCGHSPQCNQCNVSLTFHKHERTLRCHYCGYQQAVPKKCVHCESPKLNTKGTGTEQIAAELEQLLPEALIQRMDKDTMRRKFAFERMFESFQAGEIDVLVGTQMMVKGLDFAKVGLVAVIQADALLNFPDFRAEERAYQLLSQFAGRAGRRSQECTMYIQTYRPQHSLFTFLKEDDFRGFAKTQLVDRKQFLYPPYCKIVQVTFQHTSQERIQKMSDAFAHRVRHYLEQAQVLGPQEPAVNKIRNKYRIHLTLKILPTQSPQKVKKLLRKTHESLLVVSAFKAVQVQWDVDPQ